MDKYVVPSNIAISESGFLFLPTTGETFTLNHIRSRILTELKSGKQVNSIFENFTAEYDVDQKTFEKDLSDFINQLKNYRLVEEL